MTTEYRNENNEGGPSPPSSTSTVITINVDCTEDKGAAIVFPGTSDRTGIQSIKLKYAEFYESYCLSNWESWLRIARKDSSKPLHSEDLLFVMGVHKVADWVLMSFDKKSTTSLSIRSDKSPSGYIVSPSTTSSHGPYINVARPTQHTDAQFTHCIFIQTFRIGKRTDHCHSRLRIPRSWPRSAIMKMAVETLRRGAFPNERANALITAATRNRLRPAIPSSITASGHGMSMPSSPGPHDTVTGGERRREIGGVHVEGTHDARESSAVAQSVEYSGDLPVANTENALSILPQCTVTRDQHKRRTTDRTHAMLSQRVMNPYTALAEYLFRRCPLSLYAFVSDNSLVQHQELLDDWSGFSKHLSEDHPRVATTIQYCRLD